MTRSGGDSVALGELALPGGLPSLRRPWGHRGNRFLGNRRGRLLYRLNRVERCVFRFVRCKKYIVRLIT